jgi:hypothetical protein
MRWLRHSWLAISLLGTSLAACSDSGSDGNGDRDAGKDSGPSDEVQQSECTMAVTKFCELGCSCGANCTTRNGVPSGGTLALTWSDANDCAVAYTKEWCGSGTQAPSSIADCRVAVDALACSAGGAIRPRACEPAPDDGSEMTCTSDAECPGSHCAKAQRARNGNVFDQEPVETGRCATSCRMAGETRIYCGSSCTPGAEYCLLGWACTNSECQCSVDPSRPDLSKDICDRKDNDCNGVVDDPASANETCQRIGAGYTCVAGICQPPT